MQFTGIVWLHYTILFDGGSIVLVYWVPGVQTIFFILGSHYSGIMGLNYITKVGSHYTGILGSFYTGKRRSLFTGILFTLYWERDHTILIYKVYSILV